MLMKLTRRAALGLAFAAAAAPAMATETIKAVVIDGYPARALWVKEFSNFFIPEVDSRLAATGNYAMDWQESYGGSIVKPKGVLEGVRLGLGDIGIVTTIFHSSKLPSQAISAVTPFIAPDARAVARAVDEIAPEFPTMQNEMAAQNQVYLATGVVLDTYKVFSTHPISSLSDLEGSKVAGAGMKSSFVRITFTGDCWTISLPSINDLKATKRALHSLANRSICRMRITRRFCRCLSVSSTPSSYSGATTTST